jgi:hypothetical protein
MANLFGIDTEDDCREKLDELLQTCEDARQAMNKSIMSRLNDRLTEYHRMGNTNRGNDQMSTIEKNFFWPAIDGAHAIKPNVGSQQTWREKLYEVEAELQFYRSKLPKE